MTNTNNLFLLSLPEGWVDQTVHFFMGPDDSGVKHNLVVTVDGVVDKKTDLADIASQRIESLKQTLPGIEILKEEEIELPESGRAAFEVVYKYVPHDTSVIFQKQIYLVEKRKIYTFTASFSKKTIKTIGMEVDAIIDSFQVVDSKDL